MMLVYAITLSMALHFILLYTPFLQGLFQITPLNRQEWVAVVLGSLPVLVIDEGLKWVERRFVVGAVKEEARRVREGEKKGL